MKHAPLRDSSPNNRKRFRAKTTGRTLWSSTVQYYPPPPPAKYDEPFEPYALGLIDLPEGLRVLSKVTADDIEAIEVGGAVHLVIEKLHTDAEGNEVMTFKFRQS